MDRNIIIYGCGGVGSWVADFLARTGNVSNIKLVDFDTVERKNLMRQNFYNDDIGVRKVAALGYRLGSSLNQQVTLYDKKIQDEIDLLTINKDDIAIIATDNIVSKRMIASAYEDYIIVNCDKDFVEIKNKLDSEELNAWDNGGGYNSEQNIYSNIQAALITVHLISVWLEFGRPDNIKIKLKPESLWQDLAVIGEENG